MWTATAAVTDMREAIEARARFIESRPLADREAVARFYSRGNRLRDARRVREDAELPMAYWRAVHERVAARPTGTIARELDSAMDAALGFAASGPATLAAVPDHPAIRQPPAPPPVPFCRQVTIIRAQGGFTLFATEPGDGSFASNCLLARRLAERGSRFIQLYHRDWDHHSLLKEELPLRAKEVDRACMALITDLKQRGMFEDTLIVWSGEFGRTPMKQGDKGPVGRDHHNKAMSMWLAGAGVKGGLTHGATDELGYAAVDKVCTVHDLHATMLHQLGVQPEAFTFKFQGLDAKLTGVEPSKVIKEILS
jgi:hypothetical protein